MRVAVVDIGSNSTRLLVADVEPNSGAITELYRRSTVTRLGHGVDATAPSTTTPSSACSACCANTAPTIELQATANLAVLTSAVRDASNGAQFAQRVREEFGLDARVLSGDEEAQLTFLGAMSGRPEEDPDDDRPTVVVDIGGGSTEFVVGVERSARFHVSLHAGVVRMSERHIHSDPPRPEELQALAQDAADTLLAGCPLSSAPRSTTASPSPAPRRPPPRSTRSSTPTTPPAYTAMCSSWAPSNCCSRALPTWTNSSAGRSSASTPTARRRSSPA